MGRIVVWASGAEMPKLAVESSSSEDWLTVAFMSVVESRAVAHRMNVRFYRMFHNGTYANAAVAFRRAHLEREAKICDAYVLQERAGLASTTASAARAQAFLKAAKAFADCARDSPIKRTNERLTCYEAAGDCFKEARDPKKAADNYLLAELYDKAALAYKEGGRVDKMVEVLVRHENALESELCEELTTFARTHYFEVFQ